MDDTRSNGIVIGVVCDLGDEDDIARVKVTYPCSEDQESDWARLVVPMAGAGRGTFFRPEKGDEVLVGFELGDPRRPYILGSLWSQKDHPPRDDGKKEENNWRFIQSRSGHILKLDDTKGKEKVEITSKGGHRIQLDDSQNKEKVEILSKGGHQINLDDTQGSEKIEIIAKGGQKVIIDTSGNQIQIMSQSGQVKVEALNVDIKANGNMNLEAAGILTLKGGLVKIN